MPSPQKILITGGTGFVGTHAVTELVRAGWQVRCLVRGSSNRARLPAEVELFEGELTATETLRDSLIGCDAVMHIAGLIRARSQPEYLQINRDVTTVLVKAAKAVGVKRFLLCSSQAAGGPELNGWPRRVDDPQQPITNYGVSKLAGEEVLRSNAGDMWWAIVRPPAVYGPHDRAFFTFVRWVNFGFKLRLGNGSMRFNIIHVHDLAVAMRMAIEADLPSGQTFYATDGEEYTLFDMGDTVEKALGKKAIWIPIPLGVAPGIAIVIEFVAGLSGKIPLLSRQKILELSQTAWTCDGETFRSKVNFQPQYDLRSGMAQTINWYRERGWI